MAKKDKVAQVSGPRITLTPRALVLYHMGGEYSHWECGLGWFELHAHLDDKNKNYMPPQIKFFHFLHSDMLAGATYHRLPGHESKFILKMPATVVTTAKQFEAYLRRRVWLMKSAPARIYELLGMVKPVQVVTVATGEVSESLNELYARVAELMALPEADVRKRYEHLNPGLQAMNLRNRLRAKGQAV